MEFALYVNGQKADFLAVMSEIVEAAVSKALQAKPQAFTPEFNIEPLVAYKLDNPQIIKLFGVSADKHPTQTIRRMLRKKGFEPILAGRNGSRVFGSDILSYFEKMKQEQTSFLHKN